MKTQETIEQAAEKYADYSNDYVPMSFGDKFNETTKTDFIEGAKWQQERSISKEAYGDSLNMQRCSNAGYESKINELKSEIGRMYSEEDIENIWNEFVKE